MLDELIYFDSNGDGINDTAYWADESGEHFLYDENQDGLYETRLDFSDYDAYGNPHHFDYSVDTDNNGTMDTFIGGDDVSYYQMFDYDQDGTPDTVKLFEDTTGDGQYDRVTVMHADNSGSDTLFTLDTFLDYSGDQKPDYAVHVTGLDTDGDGKPDTVRFEMTDGDGNAVEEPIVMSYEDYLALNELNYTSTDCGSSNVAGQFDPATNPENVSGTPAEDMQYWEWQGQTGRCAIYAQKFAIEAITGREIPIEELVAVAEENGWFNEAAGGGTTSLNMDKLLEYYGVENEMSFDNTIEDLEAALNNGEKVIVSVDSGQIWYGHDNNIFSPETTSDHAVEVIGIDRSDPDNPMVVLNDSGSPQGCGEMVPLDVFENAWKAGDAQMIECWA